MKVSINWIKEYLDFELPPVEELVERIGSQLGAVEEVVDLGARYRGIPIVKVVVCEPLENSDHLHRCLVDDGGYIKDAERNEDGLVQVITGAPNVHQDMLAVWLAPGVTVPVTFSKDPFVLESRNMRGAMSHGMLASAKELAIGDSHEGLLDLTNETVTPGDQPIKPGADFAEVFGLNDHIIDIENKMFTHRPDCFGQLGVAREIAGILGKSFKSPARYLEAEKLAAGSGLTLEVNNEIPESVSRFMAVVLKNVEVEPSPLWLQVVLTRLGAKPINNVVDITNYMMLLTGQPMHAYDYDKVATSKLGVRFAKSGEKLALLSGKTIELNDADMVITDGEKPIGLGGVMGGVETEVSTDTKNIILECATFDMYTIRRTSMRHGLFTDAVTRFNKGQSPLQNPSVLHLAVGHLQTLTRGEIASAVIDDNHSQDFEYELPKLEVKFINERLGLHLELGKIRELLENVEFKFPDVEGKGLLVEPPFWRTDIHILEDVVEEVGRLYGYDTLPLELPRRDITPAAKDELLAAKADIRARLAKAGANEVLTYSFVHSNLLDKVGQDKTQAYQLGNALSPDLQYFRLSLMPSLLDKVHANMKAGYGEFTLFELGKVHTKERGTHGDGLPLEDEFTAFMFAANDKQQHVGAPYYEAQKYLSELIGVSLEFQPLTIDGQNAQVAKPYQPGRAAYVSLPGGEFLGIIGEFRPSVTRALKLPNFCAGFEVDTKVLAKVLAASASYSPLPRFPKVSQDITLKVTADKTYIEVYDALDKAIAANATDETLIKLEPLDIFQSTEDSSHKHFTFRFTVASYQRTLTDAEVAHMLDDAAEVVEAQIGAKRI